MILCLDYPADVKVFRTKGRKVTDLGSFHSGGLRAKQICFML
jgi:hypothetical protein